MDANKALRSGLFLCWLSTAAVGQELPDTKLLIVVYDSAHVGSKTLERSEGLTGTIMLKAGIQSSWDAGPVVDLANLDMDFSAYPERDCQAGPMPGILRLQILSHAPVSTAAQALGFSLPCSRRGVKITIYADRIAKVSETGGPTFGRVLAYAMAHELGHVLLRSSLHEETGLMKGIWSNRDWQRAAVSIISFSSAEASQINRFLQKMQGSQLAQLASLEQY